MTMSYEGPLPPPNALEAYNAVVPGGAERIFAIFEKQFAHRLELERTVVTTNAKLQVLGFWAAFFIAVGTIAAGFWLAYSGKDLAGLASIIAALGSLLAIFIIGKRVQARELAAKKLSGRPQ